MLFQTIGGRLADRFGPRIVLTGGVIWWGIFTALTALVPANITVGENGAGHYVKMVHNGIEYGDMQLICEAYNFMKSALGLSADQMQFARLSSRSDSRPLRSQRHARLLRSCTSTNMILAFPPQEYRYIALSINGGRSVW